MNPKIYKSAILVFAALFAFHISGFAQVSPPQPPAMPDTPKFEKNSFRLNVNNLAMGINRNVNDFVNNIEVSVAEISPKIEAKLNGVNMDLNLALNNIIPEINLELNGDANGFGYNYSYNSAESNCETGNKIEKIKSYSKSYSLDANDRIKLSNQYGKIMVNTWDKREIRVDVQVKVTANNEEEAQRLLDGVNISDGKNDDQVSFRTSIEPGNTRSLWKMLSFGGKKVQKLEINYNVYMPAKTDLTVEDSYGAIVLPDLYGRVNISSSYGSVTAQNLSNTANKIDGSYGSLKIGYLNGGRLDFSYGSVDIEQCNNLKADVSFGFFKLGTLKGSADFDLSYATGFKIDGLANSFKKLNINSSYSGVALKVPDSSFDFDVTTTYCGFSYNDNKVTITSKTPDDNKYHSPTKTYKGHVGKSGAEGQISIHSTYGGVKFD